MKLFQSRKVKKVYICRVGTVTRAIIHINVISKEPLVECVCVCARARACVCVCVYVHTQTS